MRSLQYKTREPGTRRVMEQETKAQCQTARYVVRSEDGADIIRKRRFLGAQHRSFRRLR